MSGQNHFNLVKLLISLCLVFIIIFKDKMKGEIKLCRLKFVVTIYCNFEVCRIMGKINNIRVYHALVAQLVEHQAAMHEIASSTLAGPTLMFLK